MLHNIGQNVTIMAGDFNCTLNPKCDGASQVESHTHSANLLRDLVRVMPYRLLPTCEPYYKALYMA